MKNKFLTLLTLTLLTGSLLVGCGGTETGTDNGAGVNTEANDDLETQVDLSKYEETDYYYMVKNEADVDTTYVDGTEMDLSDMEFFNYQPIHIKESLNMYGTGKVIVGYTKPGIDCLYFQANDEWSGIAFGLDPVTEEGGYPNGTALVRTDELLAVMEVYDDSNDNSLGSDEIEDASSEEKVYAEIITAIEEAGLIYDESAFEGIDLAEFKNNPPDVYMGYSFMSCSTPLYIDGAISDLTEFMKSYEGNKFVVEFEGIDEAAEEVNYTIFYRK